jgi:hypothetical protein
MTAKGEAKFLQKWMKKGKALAKEPPGPGDVPFNLEQLEDEAGAPGQVEQLNHKVPKGTKLRLKRLGLERGGLSMLTIFKQMLDEYEARHREKKE